MRIRIYVREICVMPTPSSLMLERETSARVAKIVAEKACPIIEEAIDFGLQFYAKCEAVAVKKALPDEHLPVFTSYLHVLEMADAVSVLIPKSCANPAQPILRSMLEALFHMEYICKADYRRRAFSWLTYYHHSRIDSYERLQAGTVVGQELRRDLENNPEGFNLDSVAEQDVQAAIDNLRLLLESPNYTETEVEYQSLRKKRGRRLDWFSFFDGPRNLRDLASHLGRAAEYEFFYRPWSSVNHATNLNRWLTKMSDGNPGFYALRSPVLLQNTANHAIWLVLKAIHILYRRFRSYDQNVSKWYKAEVMKPWRHLREMQLEFRSEEVLRPLGRLV